MFFSLLFLIGFVAANANEMKLINAYLDQMTARAGYVVSNALDKAFDEVDGSDWEIYELKRDIIDQAQVMFRPLAESVLVDSFRPRLQKRGGEDDSTYVASDSNAMPDLELASDSNAIPGWTSTDHSDGGVTFIPDPTDAVPPEANPGQSYDPTQSYNMRLSEAMKRILMDIKNLFVKIWNAVVKALNLEKVKEFFSRKQQASSGSDSEGVPKVEGTNIDPGSSAGFERFKSRLTNNLSAKNVGAITGVAVLGYLIYAFFFKKGKSEETDEYFE